MINELIKLATHLDAKGLKKEAEYLDVIIKQATGQQLAEGLGLNHHYTFTVKLHAKEDISNADLNRAAAALARSEEWGLQLSGTPGQPTRGPANEVQFTDPTLTKN